MKTTAAQRAQQVREFLGLNTRQFALSIDSDPGTYAKMEKGARNLSKGVMLAIARTYEVNLDWLADGEGEMFLANANEIVKRGEERTISLPTVTHEDAERILSLKRMQDREKLDSLALQVLNMFLANQDYILDHEGQKIAVKDATDDILAKCAYTQAQKLLEESEQWIRRK